MAAVLGPQIYVRFCTEQNIMTVDVDGGGSFSLPYDRAEVTCARGENPDLASTSVPSGRVPARSVELYEESIHFDFPGGIPVGSVTYRDNHFNDVTICLFRNY